MRFLFLTLALMLAALTVSSQTLNVEGVVKDKDGVPVIGATVQIKRTKGGAATDLDGKFALKNLRPSDVLKISYIGKKTQEVKVQPKMEIVMEDNETVLGDVMVVAFGKQKRSSFTGSAAVVGEETLSKRIVTNALSAMQGEVAGVQMVTNSGDPTEEPTIRIRGFSSINAGNDPLIILDGAPYDGGLNSINPSDIGSYSILKDAASCALYGARGANGVILITTKSAKKGQSKTTVSLDAKWGVNREASVDYEHISNPAQYYELYYSALKKYYLNTGKSDYDAHVEANNTLGLSAAKGGLGYICYAVPQGQYLVGENGKLNPAASLGNRVYNNGQFYTIQPDNWLDAAYKNAMRQEYNVSITSSNENTQTYASLGYLNNEGVAINTGFERYTARIKTDWEASRYLSMGGNIGYTHSKYNNMADGGREGDNLFYTLRRMAPIYPLYVRDGSGRIMQDANGLVYDYGDGTHHGLTRPEMAQSNLIQEPHLNTNETQANQFTLTGFADIKPFEGLKITLNGTVTNATDKTTFTINPFYGYGATLNNGNVTISQSTDLSLNFQQLINYNTTIARHHNVAVLLGHESYKTTYDYLTASKQNMVSYFGNQTLSGAISLYSADDYKIDYNNEGYFFRGQYDYEEKYFGSVSYRRDASSRFHPDHRWGDFYSLGGAWILTKERWCRHRNLDILKLKASIGQQGNDNIGDFLYTDHYRLVNSAGNVGLQYYSKGNKNITWETNTNFNLGVEYSLFNGRLSGSVEYFFRRTTDMLFFLSAPKSAGYTGSYNNIGTMDNSGVEIDVTGFLVKNKKLSWSVNANATHFRNEIKKLAEGVKNTTITNDRKGYLNESRGQILTEGKALYTWCMPKYAGVNNEGLSQWYLKDGSVTTDYSKAKSAENLFICGTAVPDLYGGFGSKLSAYGFDLSISFNYSIGGKAYDNGYAQMMTNPISGSTGYNIHKDMLNAWTPENPNSCIPRFVYGDDYTSAKSDRFLIDASYLTLQNINLSYTLPKRIIKDLKIQGVRLFVAADNICYWSKRKGFDPRGAFNGVSSTSTYSPVRNISAGFNVQF